MRNVGQQALDQSSARASSVGDDLLAENARRASFLAADVGGTHARIGLIDPNANQHAPAIVHYKKFACADYASLAEILREFVRGIDAPSVTQACIACAGYAHGDNLINANLPWQVSISEICRDLGLQRVTLVNDFKAVAYATHFHDVDDSTTIAGDGPIKLNLPRLVIGPGTGLGAAVLIPGEPRPGILTSEAGHAALAARTSLELQIVRRLGNGSAHILNEQIVSGPGLLTLYRVLCEIHAATPQFTDPAQVTAAALAGTDAIAGECVEVFCAWLGSLVGDLVMSFGAYGGVYLAGGVLPQILPLLQHSTFVERFRSKGALREVLEQVPVRLIEHGQLGVTGAAHWFLDNEYQTEQN